LKSDKGFAMTIKEAENNLQLKKLINSERKYSKRHAAKNLPTTR
jgi:hypothetical protein